MGLKRHSPSLKRSKYNTTIIKHSTKDEIIINPSNVLIPLVISRLAHWCFELTLARVLSPSKDKKKTTPTMFQNVFKTLRCYCLIVIMNA